MTHLCSDRVTHPKNTPCPRARNAGVDIIHAEGVQVLYIQRDQQPTARRAPDNPPPRALTEAVLVGHSW